MAINLDPTAHGLGHQYLAFKAINWASSGETLQTVKRYANSINLTRSPEDMPTMGEVVAITELFRALTSGLDPNTAHGLSEATRRAKAMF